ncbi:hypothetical protein DLAC_03411 [Tieghemostelium lacteum]|uniref:ubiquitinyl hydrolase 1 n=1 Tax=Tieghemostelium lacteum TaxID=361077 RepID=A0A152A1X9_TIELA|nr:hypothetical protein DLAC_03411 [Tieghemostelium lacteum]|eukprot:KYR00248.1 hypothetical protein DLAC_03411 [Tieghemostelium lacteum]
MSQNEEITYKYFEKQRLKLCGMHALNNLLQEEKFKQKDLDAIAYEIDVSNRFFNPHKSVFGIGNYDANVLIKALTDIGYQVTWFDKRKPTTEIDFSMNLYGLVINTMEKRFFNIYHARHWIAIKNLNFGKPPTQPNEHITIDQLTITENQSNQQYKFVEFNSEHRHPKLIDNIHTYIQDTIKNKNGEVLLVYR